MIFLSFLGLVGCDALVEIKCLHSIASAKLSLEEAAKSKNICLKWCPEEKTMQLKRNHHYYFQVQGQLNIARRDFCYFVVFVGETVKPHCEIIKRDNVLWNNEMVPKLLQFHRECLSQEIIRKRIPRGLPCFDPPYITEAQLSLKKKPMKYLKFCFIIN